MLQEKFKRLVPYRNSPFTQACPVSPFFLNGIGLCRPAVMRPDVICRFLTAMRILMILLLSANLFGDDRSTYVREASEAVAILSGVVLLVGALDLTVNGLDWLRQPVYIPHEKQEKSAFASGTILSAWGTSGLVSSLVVAKIVATFGRVRAMPVGRV